MNKQQYFQASALALAEIHTGHNPNDLVHVLYFPRDYYAYDEEIQGLSTPLKAGSDMSGYTEYYYTLGELAYAW
jgi:hypothetical protein